MLYCQYRYAALSVPGCCTIGTRVLHFSGTIIRVSYIDLIKKNRVNP